MIAIRKNCWVLPGIPLVIGMMLLAVIIAFGQGTGSQPLITDGKSNQYDKLLIAYQRATILGQQAETAQTRAHDTTELFKQAIADYKTAVAEQVKTDKLPAGTDFRIDIETGKVTPVPPEKTAAPTVSTTPTK